MFKCTSFVTYPKLPKHGDSASFCQTFQEEMVSLRTNVGLSETNALHLSHLLRTQDKYVHCREQLGLQLDRRVSSCGQTVPPAWLFAGSHSALPELTRPVAEMATPSVYCRGFLHSAPGTHVYSTGISHLTFSRARLEECLPSMHQVPGLISALPKIGWVFVGIPSL